MTAFLRAVSFRDTPHPISRRSRSPALFSRHLSSCAPDSFSPLLSLLSSPSSLGAMPSDSNKSTYSASMPHHPPRPELQTGRGIEAQCMVSTRQDQTWLHGPGRTPTLWRSGAGMWCVVKRYGSEEVGSQRSAAKVSVRWQAWKRWGRHMVVQIEEVDSSHYKGPWAARSSGVESCLVKGSRSFM